MSKVQIKNRYDSTVVVYECEAPEGTQNAMRFALGKAVAEKSDLRGANLVGAYLRGADLRGADLDFSAMPLWCGDLKAGYDDKQVIQQLYHVLSHAQHSPNASTRLKRALLTPELVALANEFHRVGECDGPEALEPEAGND